MKPRFPAVQLADIIRAYRKEVPAITSNAWKARTLFALMRCRTAEMGGHIDRCDNPRCNRLHISYNSCRNRHCPRCQGHLRERWIQDRERDLLNTAYFHVVFTLPDTLNPLALKKPAMLYQLLFRTAWSVLRDFAANPKLLGARTGMVAVLHTVDIFLTEKRNLPFAQELFHFPEAVSPPAGTIQWRWGCRLRFCPQVWSTATMPVL